MPSFLSRCWRGQERLYKVFWVYGLLLNLPFFAVGVAAGYLHMPLLLVPLVPVYVAYLVWVLVSMWRCAFNSSWSGWAYLGRAWVVFACVGFLIRVVQFASWVMGS